MKICSVDPGLSGAIITFDDKQIVSAKIMPTEKIEIKPAKYVLDLKDGKKQYYKTGSKKGEVKKKLKTPAKYKKELYLPEIYDIFNEADEIIIEQQNPRPGNSAMSSASTMKNFGKLMAIAELSKAKVSYVTPGVWKKYFNLNMSNSERKQLTSTQYKKLSIKKAYELSGYNTTSDGIADAICIGYWYIENKKEKNGNNQ